MKLSSFRSLLIICLLGATTPLHADNASHTSTVLRIYPFASGAYFISFASDDPTCNNSSVPKRYLVQVGQNGMTPEGSKNMYAAALFAMGLGKSVFFTFDNATSDCTIIRLQVIN